MISWVRLRRSRSAAQVRKHVAQHPLVAEDLEPVIEAVAA
jgi:hypothetical protein